MSTRNFAPMEYGMPLICGGLGYYEDYKKAYEEELGMEYSEEMFFDDLAFECEDAASEAESFSSDLEYFTVEVQSGYYSGFQFYVKAIHDRYFDLDKNSPYCIDNEDAHYYYGECRSKVLRKAESELNRIKKWLYKMAKTYGYEDLVCVGVFSNGEAVYERRNKRSELKAVARGLV